MFGPGTKTARQLALVLAAGTLAISTAASAATTTTTFEVSSYVSAACTLSAAALAFGGYDPASSTAKDGASSLTVTCTTGTGYTVSLDEGIGSGATIAQRKMNDGGTNNMNYALYSDAGRSTLWGETIGVDTVAGTGSGAAQTLNVYGRIPALQALPAGTYTDTITVTLTY